MSDQPIVVIHPYRAIDYTEPCPDCGEDYVVIEHPVRKGVPCMVTCGCRYSCEPSVDGKIVNVVTTFGKKDS